MAALPYRKNILFQKSILLPRIVLKGPFPLDTANMVYGLRKCQLKTCSPAAFHNTSAAMIGMKVCEHHIRNIPGLVAPDTKSFNKAFTVMQVSMPEKLLVLLVAPSGIDKNNMTVRFNDERAESQNNQVVLIGGLNPVSYKQLIVPTKRKGEDDGGGGSIKKKKKRQRR
mgnify:CR=1 FL=1